ncbi:MAG: hypothetical protein KatS3mg008_1312 [Acidimicrobiales bacterium]|nr:MAG: hypothetical protein KatS3mg008_1312 [Acidimicrobiales bacterium]
MSADGGLAERLRRIVGTEVQVEAPCGGSVDELLAATTHMGIGAHPDDLEIMCTAVVERCRREEGLAFCGVVCTDGASSPRSGPYAEVTDPEMVALRREEQLAAAQLGEYSTLVMLGCASATVRDTTRTPLPEALACVIECCSPREVLTHAPFDRHATHLAVAMCTIRAVRSLPRERRPARLLGCEAWCSLDWVPSGARVAMPVYDERLAAGLLEVFDSQISAGKRYDLATVGRRRANATFSDPYSTDQHPQVTLAVDLTPTMDDDVDPVDWLLGVVDGFRSNVEEALAPWR